MLNPVEVGTDTNWKSVSVGGGFTVALKTDGSLWAWGQNQDGELGDGGTTTKNSPEMVGSDHNWKSVSAGGNFVAAIKSNGTLWTWGDDQYGELGDHQQAPGFQTYRAAPAQVGGYTDWTAVVASSYHVLATQSDGSLWAWGENSQVQLGDQTTTQQNAPEHVGLHAAWSLAGNSGMSSSTSFATTVDGTLWGWGDNSSSQLAYAAIDNTVPQRTIPGVASQYLGIPVITATVGVPVRVYANALSELPVTLSVSGPATLSGDMLTVTGPGPVTVMGYQPGDVNWGSTGPVTVPVTVLPGPALPPPNGG